MFLNFTLLIMNITGIFLTKNFENENFERIFGRLNNENIIIDPETISSCDHSDLSNDLTTFPEELVASQLGNLLLARLVLLDNTAQHNLLPVIFTPKIDNEIGLFSTEKYVKYLVPKLLQMFCVRDAQIRMLLLTHFQKYFHVFSKDQLRDQILPELLVGVKDTNDKLVSLTLRALADLVPVLGAFTVIGGKRGKLFTDGRPKIHRKCPKSPSRENIRTLPERPSPDGGEDSEPTTDEETETWSDWDIPENSMVEEAIVHITNQIAKQVVEETRDDENTTGSQYDTSSTSGRIHSNSQVPDIDTLDIKTSWECKIVKDDKHNSSKVDIFDGMAPVITKAHIVDVSEFKSPTDSKSKFDVNTEASEAGWDDYLDWSDTDTSKK